MENQHQQDQDQQGQDYQGGDYNQNQGGFQPSEGGFQPADAGAYAGANPYAATAAYGAYGQQQDNQGPPQHGGPQGGPPSGPHGQFGGPAPHGFGGPGGPGGFGPGGPGSLPPVTLTNYGRPLGPPGGIIPGGPRYLGGRALPPQFGAYQGGSPTKLAGLQGGFGGQGFPAPQYPAPQGPFGGPGAHGFGGPSQPQGLQAAKAPQGAQAGQLGQGAAAGLNAGPRNAPSQAPFQGRAPPPQARNQQPMSRGTTLAAPPSFPPQNWPAQFHGGQPAQQQSAGHRIGQPIQGTYHDQQNQDQGQQQHQGFQDPGYGAPVYARASPMPGDANAEDLNKQVSGVTYSPSKAGFGGPGAPGAPNVQFMQPLRPGSPFGAVGFPGARPPIRLGGPIQPPPFGATLGGFRPSTYPSSFGPGSFGPAVGGFPRVGGPQFGAPTQFGAPSQFGGFQPQQGGAGGFQPQGGAGQQQSQQPQGNPGAPY